MHMCKTWVKWIDELKNGFSYISRGKSDHFLYSIYEPYFPEWFAVLIISNMHFPAYLLSMLENHSSCVMAKDEISVVHKLHWLWMYGCNADYFSQRDPDFASTSLFRCWKLEDRMNFLMLKKINNIIVGSRSCSVHCTSLSTMSSCDDVDAVAVNNDNVRDAL